MYDLLVATRRERVKADNYFREKLHLYFDTILNISLSETGYQETF